MKNLISGISYILFDATTYYVIHWTEFTGDQQQQLLKTAHYIRIGLNRKKFSVKIWFLFLALVGKLTGTYEDLVAIRVILLNFSAAINKKARGSVV